MGLFKIRLRRPGWRTPTALAAAAAILCGAVAVSSATKPTSTGSTAPVGQATPAQTCTQHYKPASGFDIDVCLDREEGTAIVVPSMVVNQVPQPARSPRAAAVSCFIQLEVWDDAGNRLDRANGATDAYPCQANSHGGWPLNLAALPPTVANVHTRADGTIMAHAFARLFRGGEAVHITGQGDSPTIAVNPTAYLQSGGELSTQTRNGCRPYDAQGYALSVCIDSDTAGLAATPSIWVDHAPTPGSGQTCSIDIEVWNDKNEKLADTPTDCTTLGKHTGKIPVRVSQNATVHTFARLILGGKGIYIPGQGDSPNVDLHPASGGGTTILPDNCPDQVQGGTKPVCDDKGAFQNDQPNDYNTITPDPQLEEDALANAETGKISLAAFPKAYEFFTHFLDGTGSDLQFDSTQAYTASSALRNTVDSTVARLVAGSNNGQINSGYQRFQFHIVPDTEWAMAMGGCFWRVTGSQQPDGTWHVVLQLTSYYQFRDGTDFTFGPVTVYGTKMRYLEKTGKARNFREVGRGNLTFDKNGNDTNPRGVPPHGW